MIGKILCFFMWHKWSEHGYSIPYRRGDSVWCRVVSVHCLRPGCARAKSVVRRV